MVASGTRDRIARELAAFAIEAGDILRRFREQGCAQAIKPDGSPVSEADVASENLLLARLGAAFPDYAIISEENAESHARAPTTPFFLVDPLDGTRSYLGGGDDFCVLIALVRQGEPIAGVIHAPASGRTWWAGETAFHASGGALDQAESVRLCPRRRDGRIAVISAVHAGEASRGMCRQLAVSEVRQENSAIKFARLADGDADIYPRIGRTMQWDIAAGDAILRSLGGGVFDMDGRLVTYGARPTGWDNPDFIALRCAEDLPKDLPPDRAGHAPARGAD